MKLGIKFAWSVAGISSFCVEKLDLKLLEGEFIPDSEYKKPVCSLENTDRNGHFNLHYFNRGSKKLHWDTMESDIKIFLRGRLEDFKSEHV